MLDSDQLISNSTLNKQEEQLHFTMQFSLENNEIILQDYFFFNLLDLCFLAFKRKPGDIFLFSVISNRNQKDLGYRNNPAFLLHKENGHHGCSVLPLVFPVSTQKVRACM